MFPNLFHAMKIKIVIVESLVDLKYLFDNSNHNFGTLPMGERMVKRRRRGGRKRKRESVCVCVEAMTFFLSRGGRQLY